MRDTFLAMAVLALSPCLLGDVVYLKNGDRLTGKVESLELGKLKVATEMAGTVTIALEKIQLFSTDGPVAIVAEDGTVVHTRITRYENGRFELAPTATEAAAATQPAEGTRPAVASTLPAQGGRTLSSTEVIRIGPDQTRWKGHITAGATFNSGNTNSESFNAALELNRRGDYDRILIQADYLYSREEDPDTGDERTSADRWSNRDKYDYFLSRKWYAYAGTTLEHNGVANLYFRATPGIGLGYQWIETSRTKFSTEAGVNWVYERYSDPADTHDYLAGRFAYRLSHKLSSTAELTHSFEILPNVEDFGDYTANTDAGLRLRISGHLFTEAKIIVNYDSTPAEDKEKLDQQFRLSLGYDF